MKKLRFLYFYLIRFLIRYKFRILILSVVLALFISGIVYYKDNFIHRSISEGIVGTFTQEDLPAVVTDLMSRGLVSMDASHSAVPDLAQSWTSNNESTEYTFTLKDLAWDDGSRIKSSDLNLGFADAKIETPNDKTIIFKLSDSYSPFPSLLVKPVFKKNSSIGFGPYHLFKIYKDVVFVKKLVLRSNDKNLPEVVIRFYPNEKIAKDALKIGEVKSLIGINDTHDLPSDKPYGIETHPNYNRLVTIFYNTTDPILSDENLRLALSYTSPAIKAQEEAKTSIATNSWAFNPNVKDYLENPEQAQASLKKVKNLGTAPIILTVTTSLQTVGEQVVEAWNKLGVKSVLRVESGIPQNFQALLIAQKIPEDPDQYSLWHKLGAANISRFHHDRIDKDLEDGRKLKNLDQRKQKYQDFQKALLDHAPATFLYFSKVNVVYLKKAKADLDKVLSLQKDII